MNFKKSFRSRFHLTTLLLGLALLALGGNWAFKTYFGKKQDGRGMPHGFAMPVETAKVKRDTLYEEAVTVGTLEGDEAVIVRPEIEGRVVHIGFQEGQKVSRGALLIKLDDTIYAADVAEAHASLTLSEAQNQRQSSLYKKNYTSGGKKDEATSKLKVSEAVLNRKRALLEKTRILAPFEGVIGLRKISVGDYLTPGQDIAMLVRLNPLKVRFSLPEVYVLSLKPGQKIEITAESVPGKVYEGFILALDSVVKESGRNIEIKGSLSNKEFLLKPGVFVRIRVILRKHEKALLVPEEALFLQGDKHFVYKVFEGKAHLTRVQVGLRPAAKAEIVQGLAENEDVITAGQIKIMDGMPVQALPVSKE